MYKLFTKKNNSTLSKVTNQLYRGFTIVEMLVVIGIFGILTAVVMFQYGNFNSQTIMTNMAYEVAMAARQSQVYSLGVRGQSGNTNFDNRYGVYFDTNVNEKEFVVFFDQSEIGGNPADGLCDGGVGATCLTCSGGTECLEKSSLTRDVYIARLCVAQDSVPMDIDGSCIDESIDSLSITFERPNPDAIIVNPSNPTATYGSAAIVLKTSYGDQRAVVIKSTGQISVEFLEDAS